MFLKNCTYSLISVMLKNTHILKKDKENTRFFAGLGFWVIFIFFSELLSIF